MHYYYSDLRDKYNKLVFSVSRNQAGSVMGLHRQEIRAMIWKPLLIGYWEESV